MRKKRGRFLTSLVPFLLVAVIILVWPFCSARSHLLVSEIMLLSLDITTLFLANSGACERVFTIELNKMFYENAKKRFQHEIDNGNDNADHNIHMKTTTDDFIDHSGDKNIDTISNKNEKHDDIKQDILLQTTGDTTGLVPRVVLTGDKREEWVEKQMDKFNNSSVDMDDW